MSAGRLYLVKHSTIRAIDGSSNFLLPRLFKEDSKFLHILCCDVVILIEEFFLNIFEFHELFFYILHLHQLKEDEKIGKEMIRVII